MNVFVFLFCFGCQFLEPHHMHNNKRIDSRSLHLILLRIRVAKNNFAFYNRYLEYISSFMFCVCVCVETKRGKKKSLKRVNVAVNGGDLSDRGARTKKKKMYANFERNRFPYKYDIRQKEEKVQFKPLIRVPMISSEFQMIW